MTLTTRRLVVCAFVCTAIAYRSDAQQRQDPTPVFEAADIHSSVKTVAIRLPEINSQMRGALTGNGRYELHRATMVDLIGIAWGVDSDKVIGGPGWLDEDEFEISAKVPVNVPRETLALMLQSLLADRFKLVVHGDTKPFPAYTLTAGKHPQLKEAQGGGESGCQSLPQDTRNVVLRGVPDVRVSCHGITMEEFASRLPRMAAYFQLTPVVDMTGLKGSWDFNLRFTDRRLLAEAGTEGIPIFDAVDKQLGLKLEVQQMPVPVIVVDGVNEKPTNNPSGVSQSLPAIPLRFEVADIKPSAPESTQRDFRTQPGGRVELRGFTLRDLIKVAWEIDDLDAIDNDDMLVGAPKWLDKQRFDIVALASAGAQTTGARLDINTARLTLRALLADRFKLTTHYENQPVSAFAMVALKPRLEPADPSSRPGCRNTPAPSGSAPIFLLHCQNVTMARLAEELPAFGGLYINHPVFDATGLTGGWDFDLRWSPPHLSRGAVAGPSTEGAPEDPNGALTIVEALSKLGLKLELQKHSMPVLVIDHVEDRPTDN